MPGQQNVETPEVFFQAVQEFFGVTFEYDMAADMLNAKTNKFFTEEDNSLDMNWPRDCWLWLNPTFEKLTAWIDKTYEQSRNGSDIITIWPTSSDLNQIITWKHASVYLIYGRVWSKVRSCMVCVWGKKAGSVIAGLRWDKKQLKELWRVPK